MTRRDFLTRWLPGATASTAQGGAESPGYPEKPMNSNPPSAPTSAAPTSPLQLPPLQQAVLDVATIDALFRDLAACTRVTAVLPKYAPRQHAPAQTLTLEEARTRFAAGLLLGVQIRYAYDGHAWCDTLLRRPTGVTLVRIRETDIETSVGSAAA